jgi:hypothetical protein
MNALAKEREDLTGHFNSRVSQTLRNKILEIAEYAQGEGLEDFAPAWKDSFGKPRIDDVYGHSYDGFIAFQDGGFDVNQMYASGYGGGCYFTQGEREFTEEQRRECVINYFRETFNLDRVEAEEKEAGHWWEELTETQQEELSQSESDWCEEVLLRFCIWVSREGGVVLRLSLGYRDAPYYREGYDETIIEKTFRESKILRFDAKTIWEKFLK